MPIAGWRRARRDLTRSPLVLAPGGARRGGLLCGALVLAALLVGVGGGHAYWGRQLGALQAQAGALQDLRQLEQQLEQTNFKLRLAEAHGGELERQLDALTERLRKTQEELAFFRKAREGRP